MWVLTAQTFSSILDGTFGYDKKENTTSLKIANKRTSFTEEYTQRLQNVQIECADAMYIIQSRDTPDSFFYVDPPYPNSNCGHYAGFTVDMFEANLKLLAGIKGKFLLSSYPLPVLEQYRKKYKWYQRTIEQRVSVNKGSSGKRKTEVLTANYPI